MGQLDLARVTRGVARRARTLAEGLAATGPKVWYGNNAGLRNNLGARAQLRKCRESLAPEELSKLHAIDRDRGQRLHEDGYLKLARMVDDAVLAEIRTDVNSAFSDPDRSVSVGNGATQFVIEPEKSIPSVRALLTAEVCHAITAYYGCALRVQSVRVWRNHHIPGIDGDTDDRFSNTFHHDNCPVNGLRVFVLLNDGVTRNTGAFRFHDRRTSERLIRSLGYFHRSMMPSRVRRRLVDPKTLRHFEGNAGDTCICNTQHCLHAASVPRAGAHRDILQFEVYPAEGPLIFGPTLCSDVPPDQGVLAMCAAS